VYPTPPLPRTAAKLGPNAKHKFPSPAPRILPKPGEPAGHPARKEPGIQRKHPVPRCKVCLGGRGGHRGVPTFLESLHRKCFYVGRERFRPAPLPGSALQRALRLLEREGVPCLVNVREGRERRARWHAHTAPPCLAENATAGLPQPHLNGAAASRPRAHRPRHFNGWATTARGPVDHQSTPLLLPAQRYSSRHRPALLLLRPGKAGRRLVGGGSQRGGGGAGRARQQRCCYHNGPSPGAGRPHRRKSKGRREPKAWKPLSRDLLRFAETALPGPGAGAPDDTAERPAGETPAPSRERPCRCVSRALVLLCWVNRTAPAGGADRVRSREDRARPAHHHTRATTHEHHAQEAQEENYCTSRRPPKRRTEPVHCSQ